jgi:hypothetical protein
LDGDWTEFGRGCPNLGVEPAMTRQLRSDPPTSKVLLPITAPVRATNRPEVSVTREQHPPDEGAPSSPWGIA